MLRRRDIAEKRCAMLRCNRTADGGGNMIIARRNIRYKRPQYIKRRSHADRLLYFHIRRDLVHRHMSGTFDHDLNVFGPRPLCQLAEAYKLFDLAGVRRVRKAAGPAGVSQ